MARVLKGSLFHLHTLRFIRKRNDPYLPLPSQPQLVLIYRPRRYGRLSRPWCEVAPAEICNLLITSPALYHTATCTSNGNMTLHVFRAIHILKSDFFLVLDIFLHHYRPALLHNHKPCKSKVYHTRRVLISLFQALSPYVENH